MSRLSLRGCQRVYRVLFHVALADGEIHPQERDFLDTARVVLELSKDLAASLEAEASRGEGLELGSRSAEGKVALKLLAGLVVSDGVIHPEEAERLKRIAKALGVETDFLALIIRRSLIEWNQAKGD